MSLSFDQTDPNELFEILAKLGEGSYGSVFKALDRRDGRIVAIKVLAIDSEDTGELMKEINILKECDSDYIVRYKGSYQHDTNIWIAMEYMGAGSLCDLMAICERTLGEEQIAVIMKQSLLGLEYLHAARKIHRDIKSGNLLLNLDGECKLADFGVSAELASTISKRKTVIGTPYWMAPEVLQSQEYNGKADIWSLAITAYELAVGEPPHSNVHPMRAIFMIPNSDPPTLPNPEQWSKDFHDFLAVCCQKNPEKRPSASELLRSHPFILKAKSKALIAQLVDECMAEIDEYRAQEAAEAENGGSGGNGTQAFGTMMSNTNTNSATMFAANTSGTMIPSQSGTMVQGTMRMTNTHSVTNYEDGSDSGVGDTGTMVSYPTGRKPQFVGTMVQSATTQSVDSEPSYMKHMREQQQTQASPRSGPPPLPTSSNPAQQRKINNALNTATIIQPLRSLALEQQSAQSPSSQSQAQSLSSLSNCYRTNRSLQSLLGPSPSATDVQTALQSLERAQATERALLDQYYEQQKQWCLSALQRSQ